MSSAARAFAALQERRRKRLLMGPLLANPGEQIPEDSSQPEQQQQAQQGDGDKRRGAKGKLQKEDSGQGSNKFGPSAPGSVPSRPCPSQQRALATMQRLHPTATLLSGVGEVGAFPERTPSATPLLAGRAVSSRWRKALPWAVLPLAHPRGHIPTCSASGANDGDSKRSSGEESPLRRAVQSRSDSHTIGAGHALTQQPSRGMSTVPLTGGESASPTSTSASAGLSSPIRGARDNPDHAGSTRTAQVPAIVPAASTPKAEKATAGVTPEMAEEMAARYKQLKEVIAAVSVVAPLIRPVASDRDALAARDATRQLLIVQAVNQARDVEAKLREAAASATSAAASGSGSGGDAAASASGAGGSSRGGSSAEARYMALLNRLVRAAKTDFERAQRALKKHGYATLERAEAAVGRCSGRKLEALLRKLGPGPEAAAPAAPAAPAAAREALAAAAAWDRLQSVAAAHAVAEAAAAEGDVGHEGQSALQVLRSAVLGLVLLEGCTGEETGPVGHLGPPDPLACALLGPLMRVLKSQMELDRCHKPLEPCRMWCSVSPAMLYDILMYGTLPVDGDSNVPFPRFSPRHVGQAMDECARMAPLAYTAAALGRALAAAAAPAVRAARARDIQTVRDMVATVSSAVKGPSAAGTTARGRSERGSGGVTDGEPAATAAAASATAPVTASASSLASLQLPSASPAFGGNGSAASPGGRTVRPSTCSTSSSPAATGAPGIFDCLYMETEDWSASSEAPVRNAPSDANADIGNAGRVPHILALTLASFGLLDNEHSAGAIGRLRLALCRAAAAQGKLFGERPDSQQHAADGGSGGRGDSRTPRCFSPSGLAASAAERCAARRREYAATHADWMRRNEQRLGLVQRAASAPPPLRAAAVRCIVTSLRPGLLGVHPGTWGKMVEEMEAAEAAEAATTAGQGGSGGGGGSSGSCRGGGRGSGAGGSSDRGRRQPEEVALLRRAAKCAILGLLALAGQPVPLPQLRLAYCVAAGNAYVLLPESYPAVEDNSRAVGSAVELFQYLSTVPCPLLVLPMPGWTNAEGLPTPAELQYMAALPLTHTRRQHALSVALLYCIQRYDMLPDVASVLAAWMAECERSSRRAVQAAAAAGVSPGEQGLDSEALNAMRVLTADLAALTFAAAEQRNGCSGRDG